MNYRLALFLILILFLTACGGDENTSQPQGVSIARRGESLNGLPVLAEPTEAAVPVLSPTATETAVPTAALPTATSSPEVSETVEPPTQTPAVTTAGTEPAENTQPAEPAASPELVCDPQTNRQFGAEVIALVNAARKAAGLSLLVEQAQLTQIARQHSEAMACDNFFGHVTPDGLDVEARAGQAGYSYTYLGEVIAGGYATPEDAVDSWLASSPHRAVLLEEAFTEIGAGYVFDANSEYLYYWTLVFGTPE